MSFGNANDADKCIGEGLTGTRLKRLWTKLEEHWLRKELRLGAFVSDTNRE
jgi:hypothetical protein